MSACGHTRAGNQIPWCLASSGARRRRPPSPTTSTLGRSSREGFAALSSASGRFRRAPGGDELQLLFGHFVVGLPVGEIVSGVVGIIFAPRGGGHELDDERIG